MSTSPEPPAVPASTSPSATPAPHAPTTATTATPPPPVSSPPHINITTATPPVPPSSSAAPAPDDATTIAHLALTNSELQKRRLDAEKDRELFRDMYGKASAYASEVSKENSVLEERAARAEKQVRDGLALVRGTYEAQLLALQAEVKRLKGLNALLVEKDLRSNGDDVRRRAAECEGLQVENQRLRADLAELRRDYRRMERVLEQLGERELKELSEEEEDIKHTLETTPDVPVILEPIDTPEIVVGKVEIVEAR